MDPPSANAQPSPATPPGTPPPPAESAPAPPTPPAAPPASQPALKLSRTLGKIDALSDLEQAELFACEEVIEGKWQNTIQVGLALARIRDGELFRAEFDGFEDYYRTKWQYGTRYVNDLIAAAKVVNFLGTNSSCPKPRHETQVRPLTGLELDQAKRAWEYAAGKAGNGRITARLVASAVQELQLRGPPPPAEERPRPPTLLEKQKLVDESIGQLLALLSQKADHAVLRAKVEALHGQIRALFAKGK
jgi:hypothetical protein